MSTGEFLWHQYFPNCGLLLKRFDFVFIIKMFGGVCVKLSNFSAKYRNLCTLEDVILGGLLPLSVSLTFEAFFLSWGDYFFLKLNSLLDCCSFNALLCP